MRFLPIPGLVGFAAAQSISHLDLFDYGQRGPLLGSSFGTPGANATYDYVIVGGGTAGLTIASRLALSQSNLSVAVVEAGGFYEVDNGNFSVVPGYGTLFSGLDPRDTNPLVDWGINTVPQQGAGNRVLHYARGKTLGGSSARNYMFYQRPTAGSMQKWADEVDDQSFVWDKILPYFKKSTHYTPPNPALYSNASDTPIIQAPDAFDPAGGPLQVSFSNFVSSFSGWLRLAFDLAGMPQIDGFNSGKLLGSGFGTSTINPKNAHRSSSESSFLQTALNSGSEPVVYKNTLGQKILFDSDKVATGVQVSTAGTFGTQPISFTLSAREEIILSTGAFQSPQLLMVSGVGPCDEISEFEIPCISDLPGVGKNLQDHVMFGPSHRVHLETTSVFSNNATATALSVQQYLQDASGRLSIAVPSYYGWEKLPEPYRSQLSAESIEALADYPEDWPEVEWLPLDAFVGDSSFRQGLDPADGHNYATIAAGLVAPQSRGSVKLNSTDMNTLPVVDPAFLVDPTDIELAILSFKRSREIWGKLVDLGIAEPEYYPGKNVTTDEQIHDFIEQTLSTIYHASSTCKMGKESDPMAVVDSKARVYGVHRLRVVDTSAFPFLVPGHPQSTAYALAEKIADEILNEE
ncbi:choline dehydrogenase [Aspergillus steynii IBT 23096]|uniref:Choline dehydrogenase n=1 Tax=Aspergillus steynii IBT 23096 TaxID=1392250 RepID=A0A2I2GIG9_9EURO|nr:choline dehydrogenase [Aspergillus steynii IBT 23096]PLB52659.1 choline dehydrogenase [Aspergillus steynii IBT 23096]